LIFNALSREINQNTLRNRIILLIALLPLFHIGLSQANITNDGGVIYLDKNQASNQSLDGKRGGYYGSHFLGDSIRMAMDKFQKLYVKYESTGGAYAAEKKIIFKESLYSTVLEIEKQIKKEVKGKIISSEDGKMRLGKVLNTVNTIRYYNTSELETMLALSETIESKEKILSNVRIRLE